MAAAAKLNYKAAVLKPAPPNPEVVIYSPDPSSSAYFAPIVDDCIGNVVDDKYADLYVDTIRAVVEFEGEELSQYHAKKGVFYKHFQSDLEWLSKRVQKNIVAFVGHIDEVEDFFTDIEGIYNPGYYRRNNPIRVNQQLETIVILVGCYSANRVGTENRYMAKVSPRIAFLGFDHLVHIYRGEIYMCKDHHHKPMASFTCAFENADHYKKKLLKDPTEKRNPLRTCCNAKFDRFKSMFVDELSNRHCVKITKETILKKINAILDANRMLDLPKITMRHSMYTAFSETDGERCPSDKCAPKNPYKGSVPIAESFDRAQEPYELAAELYTMFLNNVGEDKLLNRIQSIEPKKLNVLYMYNYTLPNKTLLHEFMVAQYYKLILYCVKNYTIPVYKIGIYDMTLFSLAASMDTIDENKLYEIFYFYVKRYKTNEHLTNDILDTFRYQKDEFGYGLLYYIASLPHVKLLEWYLIQTDPDGNVNYQDTYEDHEPLLNLLASRGKYIPYVWQLLLLYGADPNDKATKTGLTAMEILLQFFPFPAEIMYSLCIFGYNNKAPLEAKIQELEPRVGRNGEQEKPEDLRASIDILKRCLAIMNSSSERKRKMRKTMADSTYEKLVSNVKEYSVQLEAGEGLPKKFGNLTKLLKSPSALHLTRANKKRIQNNGLKVLKNNSKNAVERLGMLEKLIDGVTAPKADQEGGTRYKQTRKQRRH